MGIGLVVWFSFRVGEVEGSIPSCPLLVNTNLKEKKKDAKIYRWTYAAVLCPCGLIGQGVWLRIRRLRVQIPSGMVYFAINRWHILGNFKIRPPALKGVLAEWLRRLIRNQLGYARVSSNLTDVGPRNVIIKLHFWWKPPKTSHRAKPLVFKAVGYNSDFPYRESNPGLVGESHLSWPTRL